MKGSRAPRGLAMALLMAVLASSPASAQAAAPAPASASASAAPADLKDARARLAKAASPADFASTLDSLSTALPPSDALALLDQGIPQAGSEYRAALLAKAADLDLLAGLFGEAASRYEAAARMPAAGPPTAALPSGGGLDLGLLLRAARCRIAAGDSEKAAALSAEVLAATEEPGLSAAARLVGSWALAMQGRFAEASASASAIAAAPKAGSAALHAERRREARFLVWLCAESAGKAAAAAALASEFPGSPEAQIAAGSASPPPLPHWYLGGLGALQSAKKPPASSASPAPAPAAPPAAPAPATSTSPAASAAPTASIAPASASAPAARGRRLQVGYFSKEDNAQALKEELSAKGFAAFVEPRMRAAGLGKAEEKRWIVAVEGGKDIAKTMQSLKEAGYESYIIE
jgi:cell division septation protein DedD